MPELPEMEHYKLQLNRFILDKNITEVQINRNKSVNVVPDVFIQKITSQQITQIDRRAKHLLFYTDNHYVLLLHLMLGGWMFYGLEADKPKRTVQIRLSFGEHHLYFIGLRLGYLHLHDIKKVEEILSDLGPEPLSDYFTESAFRDMLRNKHGKLKSVLIDQRFIAGIGNRYSDEICFQAKILPSRNITQLSEQEINELYHSISTVLKTAVENGGYMEHPFFSGDSLTGRYEDLLKVHGREGEACKRCSSMIKMELISSHKTYYCDGCQH
ncbi:DNA-formamidopyrimidine glycosylase [Bacillus sp. FJAT-49736]|uniref:DNA-formamidopyrimidine glycosylase n=1 Tax=Bacillus sp. FJAT-49736 TaxID=2833582 RepID=UPI001BC95E0A|nr:DNA-formamidopyrimidine glycosylase [Bacillus sp. FJAT-49736]MBS4173047.1 DNA-formamidopyrimidine glycosylase [Bacillus sp. FJAT-49736]